ncbi:MAG TPA: hypothetical protein DCF68_15525 [Cyanothece sp. UBA12306]|nr:hypothetical protein [Cyanothece sp. UBA12306]
MSVLLVQNSPAWGHRPHDIVEQLELSSNYQQNQTLFIILRRNLFKSQDAGNSWQRLWKGLYHFSLIMY